MTNLKGIARAKLKVFQNRNASVWNSRADAGRYRPATSRTRSDTRSLTRCLL